MSGEQRAVRERLILAQVSLCRRAARRFLRRGVDLHDLEQTAALGLVKAADRFDPDLGTPFEVFAYQAILGELMHYVRDRERPIRLPRDLHEQQGAYRRAHERLMSEFGREPTRRELADDLRCTVDRVRDLERAVASTDLLSVEAVDEHVANDRFWDDVETRLVIEHALAALSPTERRVILGIYTLDLAQITVAERLSLHPRYVSRLRRKALDAMQERVA